jgi:hypothetical protein
MKSAFFSSFFACFFRFWRFDRLDCDHGNFYNPTEVAPAPDPSRAVMSVVLAMAPERPHLTFDGTPYLHFCAKHFRVVH